MSSLSSQLKSISEKTASVSLDRKARSKIHSRSLLFEPKVASTQDYEYIHQIAYEGLEELSELDSRFNKFKQTLFSDTSINLDRNVQTKDIVDQLNRNIEAFLTLVGPYYNLVPAIKATEWLIRRFHANIHNAELLILTSLPYYQQPVFVKILNVIPKNQFPKIFEWVVGYKDLLKAPPASSILKAFYNDFDLVKFYSMFLNEQIKNHTIYKEQLVFYLSNIVQVLASLSKNIPELNEKHMPVVLETVGLMLLPQKESKYSYSINTDLKLTAYSITSVLCSIVPLTSDLIKSLTESILQDPQSVAGTNLRSTLIVLLQLWNSYQGGIEPVDCFRNLKIENVVSHLSELKSEGFNLNKFLTFYFVSTFPNAESSKLVEYIDLSNKASYTSIANLVFKNSTTPDESVRSSLIKTSQALLKADADLFTTQLKLQDLSIDDLELRFMTVIGEKKEDDDLVFDAEDEDSSINEEEVDSTFDLSTVTVKATSYFNTDNEEEFNSLLATLSRLLTSTNVKIQKNTIFHFCSKVFKSSEVALSFIIRTSLTPAVPLFIRLSAIRYLRIRIKDLANGSTDFYLLLPIIALALSDDSKPIREGYAQILRVISDITSKLHSGKSKTKTTLFLEEQIYGNTKADKRAILPPNFGLFLCEIFAKDDTVKDMTLDASRVNKKFGQVVLKTFFLNQWSLTFWPLVLKWRAWKIVAAENKVGNDDRFFFLDGDIDGYLNKRSQWLEQANVAKVDFFDNFETSIVGLVGGASSQEKNTGKEIEWLCHGLESTSGNLQIAVNNRILEIFNKFKSVDARLKIMSKLVELLLGDDNVEFDPMATLQELEIDHDLFLHALANVQIVDQMPEQGIAKRRRRSSNSAKQAMAKDDINTMASTHLKKLTVVLEVLESKLRKDVDISRPDLLKVLFKILTDLDYLGNDGNLPVLYSQETLASCMLLSIIKMKESQQEFKFDSNSIRADLIVNSIRSSQSPQVQNRLLLVISELASLAPEIILHSVMPIFTFMGAHTIRQDDEFSNSALQQTVAKVIPAIAANGSTSISNEIEFLLTSFVTAFEHIPRHRRVKLFTSLTKTLDSAQSMHILLFLIAQQYAANIGKGKVGEAETVLEFTNAYLKGFTADEQLHGIYEFTKFWNQIPVTPLEVNSDEYQKLSSRPIFGASIVSLTSEELAKLKHQLLSFLISVLEADSGYDASSLKTKVAVVVLDSNIANDNKESVLNKFRNITSFALAGLDNFTNLSKNKDICIKLYEMLAKLLDLLPLNYFVDAIIDSLDIDNLSDTLSIKVARNYAILAGRKFESELSAANIDESVQDSVLSKLLPVLIKGINQNIDVELQQAYLDTFSTIVSKFSPSNSTYFAAHSKVLIESLSIIASDRGLLNEQPEIIISSINAITSVINLMGVKTLGLFPKIVPPALKIWENTTTAEDETSAKLLQASILVLLSSYIKKIPAFMTTTLDSVLITVLSSDLIENEIRSSVLQLIVDHMDLGQVLKSLCTIWTSKNFYQNDNSGNLGLYLNAMQSTIDKIDKKSATAQSTLFMRWLISAFEFRQYSEQNDNKFDNNTVHRLESSVHTCSIQFVMKLNDKSFRPLFANLVRWAVSGEGATFAGNTEISRLMAFFRFFNKLQEQLKSIITSYYSYLLDPVSSILKRFASGDIVATNLRRIMFISLTSSFKYDQDDYWSQQGRFESICNPLLEQLVNVEDSIGKYLVKAISTFVTNVSSEEYNEILVHGLIKFVSNENETSSSTKIWTIRTFKTIFQKMGEQWLSFLPTLVPYIAELLESDDEEVELEVRGGLVRVIENVLGEPLDRYLN
ncbi:U3 small nucleolar RNA-associated protein 10 [Spathaspora passalidarum NRRL Y-27907]|uniref:U3 small nucleolar RNA-associated protein 10 n=1 Tax=Spathaspora passalidarum (strain NRRL Y-27907 / 11-Y1) TaxID=619300 RepID=G3AP77_SPAPN|nr:U3 small nucleolar RNA-associated protein 10 [Spathaspora passalidarum NRRL Y-27907]EGW32648.1 U3 small nucleolar RNA-associated protein 10 [Spathaspora passalidarum NRRL Y-27907]